ncbi:MAG TPA: carboxypeptidase regulatory-like domain-containing protein [Terriglobia bacterium]|nr:carboxypeptidase regulatory-like domain-containing protein [Terriglobia bacterium]
MRTIGPIVLCLIASTVCAQVSGAQLTGEILDAQDHAVAGARVVVTDIRTNASLRADAGPSGGYAVFPIKPGDYRITVEANGFQRLVRGGVRFSAGERVRMDFRLVAGAVEQTLTVTADAPLLRDSSANLGQVIDSGKIVGLPLNGRSYVALAQLAPGVSIPPASSLPRINGGRPRTNEYLFDGISVLQPEPGQVAYTPVIDAVEEFKIESNSPSAEFGRFNGGVVNLTTRSGTNDIHGSVFEFSRNEALNARNLFAPATPSNPGKPLFRRNQFGFTAGGPIERDRTFFFADYQGGRQAIGRTRVSNVPTLEQRNGIFTSAIYDPATTRTDPGGAIIRDPFPSNTIPMDRFDPAALALLNRYPLPTSPGSANNYTRVGVERENQDQGDLRIDHRAGDRDQLFGRISYLVNRQFPVTPLPDGSGTLTSGALGDTRTAALSFASQYVHTVGQSATNELRVGYTRRQVVLKALELDAAPTASLGIPGIPSNAAFNSAMPVFTVAGLQQLGPSLSAYADSRTDVTELADVFAFQRGAHFLKAGFDLRFERMDIVQPPAPTGSFSFSAAQTGLPGLASSGNAFASFLLGQVDRFTIDLQQDFLKPRAMIQEYFAQDDWKAARRLTVNLGVRYTLNFPSTEVNDHGAVFNLETGQLDYLGQNGFPRSARRLHKLNFGPRLGLSYRAAESTVVRAGYALVWIEQSGITTPFTNPYFPFIQSVAERSLDGVNQAFTLSSGPAVSPVGPTADAALGQGAFAVDRDLGSGYAQQWNFAIQRELSPNLSVEIAYAGSKITHVGIPDTNINQLTVEQLAQGASLLAQAPNPYFGRIPASSSLGGPTTTLAQLLRPYPQFTNVTLFRNNVGNTSYNALEIKVERRLSGGFSALAAYTRSKLIDEASSVFDAAITTGPTANFPVADSYNRRIERDVSTGDTPNVFVGALTWQLPSGNLPRLMRGWQLTAIARAQSGMPLAVTQATNFNAFAGFGVQRPNRTGNPELPAGERSTARFFDTAAFTIAPRFTIGTSSRNPVRGPAYRNADVALIRKTPVSDRADLEFRAEVFNVTNTPPLGAPNVQLGNGAFGTISSAGDPRVVQLGIKLNY